MTIAELKEKLLREERHDIHSAMQLVEVLRSPEGCPWDREQDHHSIRTAFIEETYEAVEAIDTDNTDLLREELGDVLFQILFHTDIERDAGNFTLDDVTTELVNKMIYRHPHVFGGTEVSSSGEVLVNWDKLKTAEKRRDTLYDKLKAVPKQYPALLRAKKIAKKASGGGVSFGTDVEQSAALIDAAHRAADSTGEERERAITELLWRAVCLSSPEADPERDLSLLLDGFIRRFEPAGEGDNHTTEEPLSGKE